MRRPNPSRRLALPAMMLACGILQGVTLRDLWLPESYEPGQLQPGYFEEADDAVVLRAGERLHTYMLPDLTLDADGAVRLPPGRALVLPVMPDAEYAIRALDSTAPPYAVLGLRSEAADGVWPFGGGQVLDVAEGAPLWRPWDPARPWREDAAWRARLARACGEAEAWVLATSAPVPAVSLGRCRLPLPPASAPGGGERALALLSGPDWLRLERRPTPWVHRRGPEAAGLVVSALAALLFGAVWWRLSPPNAVSVPAALALISLGFPAEALLGWAVALLVGLTALAGLALRWTARRPLRGVWIAAATGAAVFAVAHLAARPTPPAACVLTGYSNVNGVGLRPGQDGLLEHLDTHCAPCMGRSARHAWNGATFQSVRDLLCGNPFPAEPGGRVLFLGGNNDDHFWRWNTGVRLRAHRILRALIASASLKRTEDLPLEHLPHSVERSLSLIGEQREALRAALACSDARGARFFFFHNFLVTDLAAGRPAARRTLLEARRAEVEAAGGTFVDLLEEFGDEPGVSWFADFVHFSAVAHRRVAERVCEAVEADPPGSG